MSRLAKKPIEFSKNIEIKINLPKVSVKGPKGTIDLELMDGIILEQNESSLLVSANEDIKHKSFLGLERSRLENAILGVSQGFEKRLELIGVGFKAVVKGSNIDLNLGYSHPNILSIPTELTVKVEKNTLITITGINKQQVGQFAATIRALRPPEPYKGKGVKYHDEIVRRKAGKTAK